MTIELVKKVKKSRRYSPQQKYQIVKMWREGAKDANKIAEEYNIHLTTLYYWAKQIEAGAEHFLNKKRDQKVDRQVKTLNTEIDNLKEVIVTQALELTLLKKEQR